MTKTVVPVYDYNICRHDVLLHNKLMQTESEIKKDGYAVECDDHVGLFTYVVFDTEEEAVVFKLKYL